MDILDFYLDKFKVIITNHRLAQSLLFVGSDFYFIEKFINKLIKALLCEKNTLEPCAFCSNCLMVEKNEHPDIVCITPEKAGTAIKIDQIRLLQSEIYQTPQRGTLRFVILKNAESMNKAAANALLKILEEPPAHTHFILAVEQVASIPATIISRCQLWRFNIKNQYDPLYFAQFDEDNINNESRLIILKRRQTLLNDLLSLLKKEKLPSELAAQWKDLALRDLLWFLYLVNAQLLSINTLPNSDFSEFTELKALAHLLKNKKIFQQIDKINTFKKKLSHNINMNPTLVIEDLLMDLCQGV